MIQSAIKSQVIGLFLGALAFTTALAWNSAVQSCFRHIYDSDTKTLKGQIIYAIFITMIAIVVAYVILHFGGDYDPKAKLF